jgi:hypothetical protein
VIEKYNKMVVEFMWDKKPAKVKYDCMINSLDKGGLKLQDLKTKIKAIRFKWIKKLLDEEVIKPWKDYVAFKLQEDVKIVLCANLSRADFKWTKDEFYDSIFSMWTELHYHEPISIDETVKQIIWKNSHIKVDRKTIYHKNWVSKGIIHIQNLLNEEGNFASKRYLENKYNFRSRQMEYEALMHSIPKRWKDKIKKDNTSNNIYCFLECAIKLNKVNKQICEINTKEIYWNLIDKIAQRPTSENTWHKNTELDLNEEEWKTIYLAAYKLTRDTKILSFNFKITHRTLATGEKLHTWKIKESNKCERCQEIDTIEHFLVTCYEVKQFWEYVFNWWTALTKVKFPLLTYEIIFGIPNDGDDYIINNFNFILLCGNYYVYRKKKANERLDIYEYIKDTKMKLIYKKEIMIQNETIDKFEKRWGELMQMLE